MRQPLLQLTALSNALRCPRSFGFETDDEGTLINTSSDPEDSTQNGSTEGDSEDMEKEEEEDSCLDWEEASMQLGSGARLLVGFTATPFRLNNKDLGMVFQVCKV